MEWVMGLVLNAAGMAMALYAFVVMAAWLGQRHLMYVPDRTRVTPEQAGLRGVREELLIAPDGARLVTWRTPARNGRPTLLYFHGNAGNLAGRAARFQRYQSKGYGILMMSWRGYGGSTGQPSETSNVADAIRAYDHLLEAHVKPSDIVVYGESLGSGVAVQLAGVRVVGGLVLDAPYTSVLEVAMLSYPYLPVRPLLVDRYESNRHIGRVSAPVLILHGERDAVIPVRMGKELHRLAPEPKKLVLFPDGGHVDLDGYGAVEFVDEWLTEIRSQSGGTDGPKTSR